jgi:hypothetical protein
MSWMCGRVGVEWANDSGYLGASLAKIEVFDSNGMLDGTSAVSAELISRAGFTSPFAAMKWWCVGPGTYEALVSYPAAVTGPWALQVSVTQAGMDTEVLPFTIAGGYLP